MSRRSKLFVIVAFLTLGLSSFAEAQGLRIPPVARARFVDGVVRASYPRLRTNLLVGFRSAPQPYAPGRELFLATFIDRPLYQDVAWKPTVTTIFGDMDSSYGSPTLGFGSLIDLGTGEARYLGVSGPSLF